MIAVTDYNNFTYTEPFMHEGMRVIHGAEIPYLHRFKFNPQYRNCFSYRHFKSVEFVRISDGAIIDKNEAEKCESEKRLDLRKVMCPQRNREYPNDLEIV